MIVSALRARAASMAASASWPDRPTLRRDRSATGTGGTPDGNVLRYTSRHRREFHAPDPMPAVRRFPFVCAILALTAAAAARASAPDPAAFAAAEQKFADDIAREGGLDRGEVLATVSRAHYQQTVIDAISRPAEAKPWKDYRPIFVTDRRIEDGVAFLRTNAALLKRVEGEFGVPAPLIVTILGVETNYGRVTGRYRVLDALATLAFAYPPRQDFFRSELKQLFLLHGASFPYPIDGLMGSYAGAMGWGQFMPSSIANFARDYDRDGKVFVEFAAGHRRQRRQLSLSAHQRRTRIGTRRTRQCRPWRSRRRGWNRPTRCNSWPNGVIAPPTAAASTSSTG
jgi:hypothetical protein